MADDDSDVDGDDMIMIMTLRGGHVEPKDLKDAIVKHLEAFKAANVNDWIPKCHWALHLPRQLLEHGLLIACFALERKHKELKRTAEELDNTSKDFEKKMLLDAVYSHFSALSRPLHVPVVVERLIDPKPAPEALSRELCAKFDIDNHDGSIAPMISPTAVCPPLRKFERGDVALLCCEGQQMIAEIQGHASILDVCMTFVHVWQQRGDNIYEISNDHEIVPLHAMVEACVFKRMGDFAVVLKPDQE